MKTPRYTDNRYRHGYTPAAATDITKTFARERKRIAELEKTAQKTRVKVRSIAK
jgi:hypothetical protein